MASSSIDVTAELCTSFTAMASTVTIRLAPDAPSPQEMIGRARAVFGDVEQQCTRFDRDSPLMQANAAGEAWHVVPRYCFAALSEAASAHQVTDAIFDPRVLRALLELGYDRSLPFAAGDVELGARSVPVAQRRASDRWRPGFDPARSAVRIGPIPVDLGGIAKGLAIRWVAEELARACDSYLIEAGGDCYLAGDGPEGAGWQVAVEDPRGGTQPIAVLNVHSAGCATSSVRLRQWTVAGRRVHHLIDPRTGTPGGRGLLAVTVVGPDPAMDEVWSKVLFLLGSKDIAAHAAAHDLAALWVADDGAIGMSEAIAPAVIWQAS
ncbi:MAG: FAD:protein FMN transferase [Pseudonocardiales bacterium]